MDIEAAFTAIKAIIGATSTPGGDSAQDDVLDAIVNFMDEQRRVLEAAGEWDTD